MTVIGVIWDTDFKVNHPGVGPVSPNVLKHATNIPKYETIPYFSC